MERFDSRTHVDVGAYVHGYQLKASFQSFWFPLWLPATKGWTSRFIPHLTSAFVVCNISGADSGSYHLTGCTLAGRWPATDLVHQIPRFQTMVGSSFPLCTDAPGYPGLKSIACGLADVVTDVTAPASAACDAVSFAMAFETEPVHLGDLQDFKVAPEECPSDVDPGTDSCETTQ